jgi:hypothetical protein
MKFAHNVEKEQGREREDFIVMFIMKSVQIMVM